jgi:hypothetical protein
MSWIHDSDDDGEPALGWGGSHEAGVDRSAQPTAWDPLEVWLTRVKQPRDRAALRAAASPSHDAPKRQD